jgi:hypothetical protein
MDGRPHNMALVVMKDGDCLCNTKSEQRKKKARENALQEIVQGLNFPELGAKDVEMKIKTICTKYAAEPAKVRKPEKKVMLACTTSMCRNCVG